MTEQRPVNHNLPHLTTSFVGRQAEIAEIAKLLDEPTCQLLTLVGPGGIGKTRLAIEAAQRLVENGSGSSFADGVYFVALQPLTSPDYIMPAAAEAVRFQFQPGEDPKQQFLNFLSQKSLLMVLDNFEHLLDGLGLVEDVLTHARQVKIVVTSRERLNLREEWVLEVGGLDFPASEDEKDIGAYSAVQLFAQNAHRVNIGFNLTSSQESAVVHICRMVGGMPLGIELAATWVRALSCEQIARELEHSLDILETPARNVPPRHRNMRAAFEPTWQRLTETEREVFKKLSVFRGGFTLEAAHAVARASLRTLSSLVDKSLLRVDTNGRYDLHELLRQYGEEQLKASMEESEQIHDLHCTYYAEFVWQKWENMIGPQMSEALDAVEKELENIRPAWAWGASHIKREELWKFISGLQQVYYHRSRFQEAIIAYAQAADGIEAGASHGANDDLLASILANHAYFCGQAGLIQQWNESHHKSLALLRQLGDLGNRREMVEALSMLAWASRDVRPLEARHLSQECITIARARGYYRELEWVLLVLASTDLWMLEDYVEGKQASEEALELARQFGHPAGMGICALLLGQVAFSEGRYAEAKRLQWESYRTLKDLGARSNLLTSLWFLGEIAVAEGDYGEARRLYLEAISITKEVFPVKGLQIPLAGIAKLLAREGHREQAVELSVLVLDQPVFIGFSPKGKATRLLQSLEADLSPEAFAAAVERGKARKIDETMSELVADLSQPSDSALRLDSTAIKQPLLDPLSERELEVLHWVASGLSNAEIAERLMIGLSTVKKHLNHIYSKLGVETRTQALLRAQSLNLI